MRSIVLSFCLLAFALACDPWDANTVYHQGDCVTYQDDTYYALYYVEGATPDSTPTGSWQKFITDANGNAVWTNSRVFNTGERASFNGKMYGANYYTRDQQPDLNLDPWTVLGEYPCRADRQIDTVEHMFELMVYPHSSEVWADFKNGVYDQVEFISENFQGLNNPTNYYANRDEFIAMQYGIYGQVPGEIRPHTNYSILEVIPHTETVCHDNICFFHKTIVTQTELDLPLSNLTYLGWVGFDSNDRIVAMASGIPGIADFNQDFTNPQAKYYLTFFVCNAVTYSCTGTNQQYADMTDCMTQVGSLATGDITLSNRNTIMCRFLQSQLVSGIPDQQCHFTGFAPSFACKDATPDEDLAFVDQVRDLVADDYLESDSICFH